MKKTIVIILSIILFCGILSGCGTPSFPAENQIRMDLGDYYGSSYTITTVQSTSQNYDSEDKTATLNYSVNADASSGTFTRTDEWTLTYLYQDKEWFLFDRKCVSTEYELTSDLSESESSSLISWKLGRDVSVSDLTTNRSLKNASADYNYEAVTADYGNLGMLITKAEGTALFSWHPDQGWVLGDVVPTNTEYLCNLSAHISVNNKGLNSERFTMSFDLDIVDNQASIQNLQYQGGLRTLGNLHISNAEFHQQNDGESVIVSFDYKRDVENIENDPGYVDVDPIYQQLYREANGTGVIQLEPKESNETHGHVELYDFMADGATGWSNYVSNYYDEVEVTEKN